MTAYIGNFVYQNDSLQYMLTPEGRTVFDLSNSSNTEQFFVKDHLGNVRSVVETAPMPLLPYLASYELAAANTESLLFDKVGEIRTDKPGGGGDDTEAGKLDGSVDSLITGTSLLLQVMAGDEVELQADNYYEDYDPTGDLPLQVGDIMHSLVTTLAGGISAIGQREGISGSTISGMLQSSANISSLTHVMDSITDHSRPAAYLTYMQFDDKMNLVQGGSGAYQVTGDGAWTIIGTNGQPVKVLEDGYMIVSINDRSERPVFFDRIQVLFHRGKLKEEDHYYPYGLPMANIGSAAAGTMPNRRKYQGNEFITEAGLDWMSFGARQYDPQTGRFLSIDPLAGAGGQGRFSPYAAMGDQPAGNVDPNGTNFQIPYLTTRSAGGMPDETSEAMAWNLNHMKKSLAGANFGWGNDTRDELYWGGGGGGGQADMEWNMLSELFDAISGIGNPGGASSGYACNFANGIGSPGGDGASDDGSGSTTVQDNGGGSYTVTGSNPDDGDCNIYVEGTNKVIGQTFTPGEFSLTNDGTGGYRAPTLGLTFNINQLADGNKLVNSFSALWKATVLSMQSSYGAAITLATMSRNGGTYDIKSRFGNPYTPFMFNGRVTTIRSLGNILFGRNLRAINRYSLDQLSTPAGQWYMETMPWVGQYNQHQNNGNGYNAGWPFYGEHTYSGTGIYYGYFGTRP